MDDNDDFINDHQSKQKAAYKKQGEILDDLHKNVQTLKTISTDIHTELLYQQPMLDDLENGVDNANRKLATSNKTIDTILQKLKSNMPWCIIIVLVLVLIVLIILAVKLPGHTSLQN